MSKPESLQNAPVCFASLAMRVAQKAKAPAADVRLAGMVDHDAKLRDAMQQREDGIELAGPHQRVEAEPGRRHRRERGQHIAAQNPLGIGKVLEHGTQPHEPRVGGQLRDPVRRADGAARSDQPTTPPTRPLECARRSSKKAVSASVGAAWTRMVAVMSPSSGRRSSSVKSRSIARSGVSQP